MAEIIHQFLNDRGNDGLALLSDGRWVDYDPEFGPRSVNPQKFLVPAGETTGLFGSVIKKFNLLSGIQGNFQIREITLGSDVWWDVIKTPVVDTTRRGRNEQLASRSR